MNAYVKITYKGASDTKGARLLVRVKNKTFTFPRDYSVTVGTQIDGEEIKAAIRGELDRDALRWVTAPDPKDNDVTHLIVF